VQVVSSILTAGSTSFPTTTSHNTCYNLQNDPQVRVLRPKTKKKNVDNPI
jgi:hypothetical protein